MLNVDEVMQMAGVFNTSLYTCFNDLVGVKGNAIQLGSITITKFACLFIFIISSYIAFGMSIALFCKWVSFTLPMMSLHP
ncbi:hypothetical protein GPUN_0886 [Glaciecola punicea ACAM 611]|uniref:Uncharacterized protein n=1 Tax=Glaciecola punicea ACAM 611 TaxID=1121923 RepID=H5T9P1_9ALTE|nr:hypothetical protein GPUN_0886 [Glaciecola punicea ACAM 611]